MVTHIHIWDLPIAVFLLQNYMVTRHMLDSVIGMTCVPSKPKFNFLLPIGLNEFLCSPDQSISCHHYNVPGKDL